MKKIKELVSWKYIIELIFMVAFYMMLDKSGIIKYVVAMCVSVAFLYFGRKKRWSADALICVALPVVLYLTLGGVGTLLSGTPQATSVKEVLFWIVPLIVTFSVYTFYEQSMHHIVDIQFWASCIAYLYPRLRFIIEHSISESTYAFVFGAFGIYYAYRRNWSKFAISMILMYLANKRIAMLACAVALLILFVQWVFKNSKELMIVIWGVVSTGIFYYVFLIHSGLLRYFCNRLGIDSKGRVQTYARFSEMYDFSPWFFGKGLGNIENILNQWQIKYYGNLHNDLLKFYLEIGFIGLLVFLAGYGIALIIAEKKFGKGPMSFMLSMVIYYMLLCATDNVSIYIIYLVPMYSMMFAVLALGKNDTC